MSDLCSPFSSSLLPLGFCRRGQGACTGAAGSCRVRGPGLGISDSEDAEARAHCGCGATPATGGTGSSLSSRPSWG